ncbi:CCA tRNA nucleotidyltransferase [Salinicoccus sp. CNSTN-B1]
MHELFILGGEILKTLKSNGFEGYFVGGCVRDYYMGRTVNDVDITTNALPDQIESLFPQTIDVGKEHGTVIVRISGVSFEVTTYRTEEGYSDFRRPDRVSFTNRLYTDLERRDFTMNAMAMDENFKILDPYSGKADIAGGIIRTVGCPRERFGEDALRMLRAARFSSQLQFDVETATQDAMTESAKYLEHVAVERTVAELVKLYAGQDNIKAKHVLIKTGITAHLPFFKHVCETSFLKTRPKSLLEEIALQIWLDEDLYDALNTLKLSNEMKNEINQILKLSEDAAHEDYLMLAYNFSDRILSVASSMMGANPFFSSPLKVQNITAAIGVKSDLPIHSQKDIAIDGKQLMAYFNLSGGKWIRTIMEALEEEILRGNLKNDKYEIMKWMDAHVEIETGHIKIIKE